MEYSVLLIVEHSSGAGDLSTSSMTNRAGDSGCCRHHSGCCRHDLSDPSQVSVLGLRIRIITGGVAVVTSGRATIALRAASGVRDPPTDP